MHRVLSFLILLGTVCSLPSLTSVAMADPVFEVTVDRASIGMDESVSLRMKVVTDGVPSTQEPEFSAPDFDLVNQYSSVFVQSYYEKGRFGSRNNRTYTKVLRPTRTGELEISGLEVRLPNGVLRHPSIRVLVGAAGRGTPPPPGYGSGGAGLRGASRQSPGARLPFMVRAEVDSSRVIKGQQIVVSYYLYQRLRVHNIQVEKYPVLDGFLREDLELPILGQRLTDRESVVLDGVPYERVLLARYAAYPLKEGRLAIDSMAIKASYYPPAGGGSIGDEQDPVSNMLQNFMQQLQPRTASHRSDPVKIEVLSIPLDGRPASFSGGVGDFEIVSAVDKTTVKVNEPITMTVKIEGRGNTGAIGQPPAKWPEDIEVYETKSRVAHSRGGVATKIFEILLIPRRAGSVVLPAQVLSFFAPATGRYETRTAPDIHVEVEGSSGATASSPQPQGLGRSSEGSSSSGIDGNLLLPEQWVGGAGASSSSVSQRLVWGMVLLSGLALLGALASGAVRKWRRLRGVRGARKGHTASSWSSLCESLQSEAESGQQCSWREVPPYYQRLSEGLLDELERVLRIPARAWSRSEIRRHLEERTAEGTGLMDSSLWMRVENVLEYAEAVQFSGAVEQQEARDRMLPKLREADRIVAQLRAGDSEDA